MISPTTINLCAREDLNLHTLRHIHLKDTCIPISPLAHIAPTHYSQHTIYFQVNSKRKNSFSELFLNLAGCKCDYSALASVVSSTTSASTTSSSATGPRAAAALDVSGFIISIFIRLLISLAAFSRI